MLEVNVLQFMCGIFSIPSPIHPSVPVDDVEGGEDDDEDDVDDLVEPGGPRVIELVGADGLVAGGGVGRRAAHELQGATGKEGKGD